MQVPDSIKAVPGMDDKPNQPYYYNRCQIIMNKLATIEFGFKQK
jgi:hypothetical protein